MSNAWYCIPSKRPPAEAAKCLDAWRERGCKIALYVDLGSPEIRTDECLIGEYPGYARAVNRLVKLVLRHHPETDWIVTGGDDVYPDASHTADEIAAQCSQNFGGTFGVMQPTGDRWGDDATSRAIWPTAPAYIDRICGSPWMGRSFCERINQGKGPLWPEYPHNWVDEELQNVAIKYGCFWQRRDLIHFHNHCMRAPGGVWAPHLKGASDDYRRMKPLFDQRKREGFPGSEPI